MGFVIASVGLRLLVRRRFRHNAQASQLYSFGIQIMKFGAWPFTAGLILWALFAGNDSWAMLVLVPLVGYLLVAGGYFMAFVLATMTVLDEMGPSNNTNRRSRHGAYTQATARSAAPAQMYAFVAPLLAQSRRASRGQPTIVENLGPSIGGAMTTNNTASD